ncbi:MAG: branched-chain amino acid ABC transporter permease [Nitrososphaerales archaeon]
MVKIISLHPRKLIPLSIILLILFLFPIFAPAYQIFLLSYALLLAITALGYNLLFGKTGLLSFGHAAYFGLGAYVPGFLTTYTNIRSLEVWLILSICVSALFGILIGYICVRYTKIHFALLTLAFSMMFYSLLFKFYSITRGDDGLHVAIADILGLSMSHLSKDAYIAGPLYYAILAIFLVLTGVGWIIYNSPFGKTLEAIGNNSARVEFLGVPAKRYKWYAFIISAIYGGIAGALFAILSGHVSPTALHWIFSGEIVFMCILGGTKFFLGPIIGALLFTYLKTYAITFTIYWQIVFGSILIFLVLLLPKGIVGEAITLLKKVITGGGDKI